MMVLQCPACLPRVGFPACQRCYGSGRLYVKRLEGSNDPLLGNWFSGYHPNCKPAPEPFQIIEGYECADGWVEQGISFCPEYLDSLEDYFAAMEEAGWDTERNRPKED